MRTELRFICPLPQGVHARPASMLADVARRFASTLTIHKEGGGRPVDVRSVLSVVGLDIKHGDGFVLTADGADAEAAMEELRRLIEGPWAEADEPTEASAAADAVAAHRAELPIGLRQLNIAFAPGTPACGGVGVGAAVLVAGLSLPPEAMAARPGSAKAELEAAHRALAAIGADLRRRASATRSRFETDLLAAHASIADDPALRAEIDERIVRGATAAQAVAAAAAEFAALLGTAASAYVRDRAIDVQDVCQQVIERLMGGRAGGAPSPQVHISLPGDSVVLADLLTPNQLMRMDHKLLKGLVLGSVGLTSHTIILARSLRIPTVIDAREALSLGPPGTPLVLDAEHGLVIRAENPAVARYYGSHRRALERRRTHLAPVALAQARTRDGMRLEIGANAASAPEVTAAVDSGAEGVGLLRTELLFLDRDAAPSEEEQLEAYGAVLEAAGGRPVIIRTFDIGGDKPAPYLRLAREENPFLGVRGLRLYPRFPDLLRTQLRAILRASVRGAVKVMAPMVASPSEAAWFRAQIAAAQDELRTRAVPFDQRIPVGVMIEIPAAALALDHIAASADFASLGTNDLSQYWAAADRTNPAVSPLARPLEPSFLRFLSTIAERARAAKLWLGMCGEMASRPLHLPLLVGLGLDEISAAPGDVLGLKHLLSNLDSAACRAVLAEALTRSSAAEVEALLLQFSGRARADLPILDDAAITTGVEVSSKEEAIREAVNCLFVVGRTDRPREVEEAVWARERTYSTGLGFGFAIPHCKTDAVCAPTLVAMGLKSPIDWGSSDGEPVRFVLLLAVPTADAAGAHMTVFATLARRLMHEPFREALLAAPSPGAIATILRRELALQ